MQIVINISEESYKNIKEQVDKRDYPDMQIGRAIADGVLIPECGIEESGGHAYNCNDCPNKCEAWYQWEKEMKKGE